MKETRIESFAPPCVNDTSFGKLILRTSGYISGKCYNPSHRESISEAYKSFSCQIMPVYNCIVLANFMRVFEKPHTAPEEFFLSKMSYGVSLIFHSDSYSSSDHRVVLAEFEPSDCDNRESLAAALGEVSHDVDLAGVSVHACLSSLPVRENTDLCVEHPVLSISIPNNVEEVHDEYFPKFSALFHVTFRVESPSLKRIGVSAFLQCGMREVYIPDSVEYLSNRCFFECRSLSRVAFGESSTLRQTGIEAFFKCGLTEIHIPDSVEELCDMCFLGCEALERVTFGDLSRLKRIGNGAFGVCGLRKIRIPNSVEELCSACFCECSSLSHVTFGECPLLKRIERLAFFDCDLTELFIPGSVEELGEHCFSNCMRLSRFRFGHSMPFRDMSDQEFDRLFKCLVIF